MSFRYFILAAALHGSSIALAFAILPASTPKTSPSAMGKVEVEHAVSSQEPAQLPTREITHTQKPEVTAAETVPSFVAELAPEEPVKVEICPDPINQRPPSEENLPSRPKPALQLPRQAKEPRVSPSERAATPVENAPCSGTSGGFTPPALLSWDPPRSLLYGHRGLIVAIIELDERGQVRSVSLKQGTGDADIDGETRAALMKGKFCGAREGERGINTTFTVRFNITEPK